MIQRTLPRLATISSGKSLRSRGPTLTLEQFVQRQKVLALWRDCVRTIYKIPKSSDTRGEMRDFARHEFERYKHVNDISHIRYLTSTGKTQLDSMRRLVEQNVR
ncbi:hypothetical protein M409DRAFT_30291 [Zasmidium cellare ATCC 36951]|uniref:LYR motif-containing protein 2 n=1 Tax=Zasmidium cellare ATCC 36951 TaxID=1080233 RepID=A0A6A6BWS2_ZASCE|nr:uncharacterized protein M409DRAFT_30291 [Zasmidium cellare ATCC 36951]KAF2159284.1 hypothetical protein M409DRAFT_30291 [Zasmidium cellare ATCC 36951]